MKYIPILLLITALHQHAYSQTLTDGLMMPKKDFCTGFMYGHDQWKDYWEGDLKRNNRNIGTLTTTSLTWFGNYGITNKINVIAMLPYIWTKASGGTLSPMEGVQDMTLAVKYNFFETSFDSSSTLKAFVVGSYTAPLSDYTADFYPLSIGSSSQQLGVRLTVNYKDKLGWYVNGSGAYTYRSNVTLDRPSYFTDRQLHLTNEVFMPNVFDFSFSVGYIKRGLQAQLSYIEQNTLGGGDIRRQDMPFVSNQMNFSKLEGLVMYYLPKPKNLAARAAYSYTVAGRNVGQSSMWMAGLMYTFHFSKKTIM